MPRLNYVSQTAISVSVSYADMPAATEIVFVDKTSGRQFPSTNGALAAGGNGSADIAIPGLAKGEYCLLAQSGGTYLAQTVPFTLN